MGIDKFLLSEADPELKKQFVDMLRQQMDTHELQKTHRCWFFIPSPAEYERMKKFAIAPNYDRCPKCSKGRVVVEIYQGNLSDSWSLVCRWGDADCGYKEHISDDID